MADSAPAIAYGAPDMTHFPLPAVAPAVTYMGEAASVAPALAVTYGAPPVVTSDHSHDACCRCTGFECTHRRFDTMQG